MLEVVEAGPQRGASASAQGGREFMGEGGLARRRVSVDGDPQPARAEPVDALGHLGDHRRAGL
jgi:hypothetical protein